MNTIIGIRKTDIEKLPREFRNWKQTEKASAIQVAYDKLSPSEWFVIPEEIEKLEIGYQQVSLEDWRYNKELAVRRLACESNLPKTLLSLGISYILLKLDQKFLDRKVKKEKFGSKSGLYPEKKKSKKEEETKKTYIPKKTKSQKAKVKLFLGFFEGFTEK